MYFHLKFSEMRFFYVIFFIVIFTSLSCGFLSEDDKNHNLNTVIDYTKVDVSPTFKNCKNLSIKKNSVCFSEEINKRIQATLITYNFVAEEDISEVILIDLLIDNKGNFRLKKITASIAIKNQFPKLDSAIRNAIKKLPRITPAFKRGVPVITQYQLPIKIVAKEVID